MKTLLLSLVTFIWAFPVHAKISSETTDALEERVRAALPKGWRVSYDKNDTFLQITRTKKALAFTAYPNQPPEQEPEMASFALSFRVVPRVSLEEYNRLSVENKKTNQEIEALYKILESRGLSQKFDSFLADKEEDKKLVDQYDKLRKSLHDLPDFYFRDISLKWIYGSADFPLVHMQDENIQKECEEVRDKIVKLFDQYEAVSP